MEQGFWWARRKRDGKLTILQVTDWDGSLKKLAVQFIGSDYVCDIDDPTIADQFEFLTRIEQPST